MNLKDLEYLVAIDEEQHFNKAAARCFVSQPTLSGQLKKLEDKLGVLLVERNNRNVRMTEVGRATANQARRILAQCKELIEVAQSYHDPMAGELNVGLIPTIAPYLLPIIMPAIKKNYPQLTLWLHEHQTDALLDKLRHAKLDLLILALSPTNGEFSQLDLFKEAFWLATPRDDALAQKPYINLRDLDKRELLLLDEGHCLRGQALDICFSAGASEYSGYKATSLETLRHMVAEGLGMTLMPKLAVPKRLNKDDNIRYIAFKNPQPSRRIGMLYRKNNYRELAFKSIAKIIQPLMKKY